MTEQTAKVLELEPDRVRLTDLQGAVVDQLVEQRLARVGGDAHAARREILRDVIVMGLAAVQGEEA